MVVPTSTSEKRSQAGILHLPLEGQRPEQAALASRLLSAVVCTAAGLISTTRSVGRWCAGAQQLWPVRAKQSLCFASLLALNTQYFGQRRRLGLRMRCRVRVLGMQPAHRRWCQQISSSGWKNCAGKPLWCSSGKPAEHPLSWHGLSMHDDVLAQGAAFSHHTLAPPCWRSPS